MGDQPIFLSYLFNGWRFEFHDNYVEMTNPANNDRYRMVFNPYEMPPFVVTLIEKGTSW